MKLKFIVHHGFFGFIAYLACGYIMSAVIANETFGLNMLSAVLLGIGIFLLASGKIITYRERFQFHGSVKGIWKPAFLLSTAIVFALLLFIGLWYTRVVDIADIDTLTGTLIPENTDTVEWAQQRFDRIINLFVLLLGLLYFWFLYFKLLLSGHARHYLKNVFQFIIRFVSVYLIYRLAIILITTVGALLMGLSSGGVQNDYFLFAQDDELVQNMASGFLSGSSFLSGVTAASSYFVLSSMAKEHLSHKESSSFLSRLRRMFLDVDTIKLLIMTLASVIIGLLSITQANDTLETLLTSITIPLWAISAVLFIADTRIIDFLIHFTTMTFIERLIQIPDLTGGIGFISSVGLTVIRILMFAAVAVLIAEYQLYTENRLQRNPELTSTLSHRITQCTFLQFIIILERIAEHGIRAFRKDPPKSQNEEDAYTIVRIFRTIDEWLEKLLTGRSTDKSDSNE